MTNTEKMKAIIRLYKIPQKDEDKDELRAKNSYGPDRLYRRRRNYFGW